jgi:hypothetical protein
MVMRIAPIRVICFCLLAACGALCQKSADLIQELQFDGSNSPQRQGEETSTSGPLPDAPSVQPPTQADEFRTFFAEARSPLTLTAVGANARVIRETDLDHLKAARQLSYTGLYKARSIQDRSSAFFGRYLYPSVLKQRLRYHPSTSASLMGRAAYAASRIFIVRDDGGKGRLNTSYFLGVLTSVAIHTAYRPYWARSASATFNNFGSTIGSDAGINLFHEFQPGLLQMMKGHTPRFVSRIEARISDDQTRRDAVSLPAR